MKKFLQRAIKKYYVFPLMIATLFVIMPVTITYAQNDGKSVSGDEICGQWDPTANEGKGAIVNPCSLDVLGVVTKRVLTLVVSLGLPLLVVFVTYRFVMAWFALQQGNAGAYKDALKASRDAILGFFLIVALMGGFFFVMLKYLGVNPRVLENIKLLSVSSSFVERAHAGGPPLEKGTCQPKSVGFYCITNNDKNGFCINDGMNPSCAILGASGSNIPKGACGPATGVRCTTDDGKDGACFIGRCILLVETPSAQAPAPAPAQTGQPARVQAPQDACSSGFNMTGVCNLYDFILNILRLIMRFFIYPALVTIWVWTGFSFVFAQGNPEGLNKAKKWLMWGVVTTLVVFLLQAFLTAARGTVQNILPASTTNTNVNGTVDGRGAPVQSPARIACDKAGGSLGVDGVCYKGRG